MTALTSSKKAEVNRLAKMLKPMDDNILVSDLIFSMMDSIDVEALDALCYNGLYDDDGKYDGHAYYKLVQRIEKYTVLRVGIVTYYRDQNPSCYNEDGEEINGIAALPEYTPEKNYFECVQFWFTPDGEMLTRSLERGEDKRFIEVNQCWSEHSKMDFNKSDISFVMRDNDLAYPEYDSDIIYNCKKYRSKSFNACMAFINKQDNERSKDNFYETYDERRKLMSEAVTAWGYDERYNNIDNAIKYYPQIFLAHRNHIDLNRYQSYKWFDLIDLMKMENGNLQNVREFCPTDIDAAIEMWQRRHERHIAQKEREEQIRIKEKVQRQLIENKDFIDKANEGYMMHKKCFLGLRFDTETMEFHVLNNVEEFCEEGIRQEHCVFSHNYFEMPDCIILSCRDKRGKIISTVTVDVKEMRITSNLGHYNSVPRNAIEIQDFVMMQMPVFRKAYEQQQLIDSNYCPSKEIIQLQNKERNLNKSLGNGVYEQRMEEQRTEILKQMNLAI